MIVVKKANLWQTTKGFLFVLRFRTNYFHTEALGYELLSAYDAVR